LKIPPLNITRLLFCLLGVACLVGCSTGNKFASSFGKRRYEKGYYWDRAKSGETVHEKTERETVNRNSVGAGNRKSETTLPVFDAGNNVISKPAPAIQEKKATPGFSIPLINKSENYNALKVEKSLAQQGIGGDSRGSLNSSSSSAGTTGFVLSVIGAVLILGTIFVLLALAESGGASLAIALFCLLLVGMGLLAELIAFVTCIVALNHNDNSKGMARAGLIISGIFLGIFFLLLLLAHTGI
jgi:hypothetical protein